MPYLEGYPARLLPIFWSSTFFQNWTFRYSKRDAPPKKKSHIEEQKDKNMFSLLTKNLSGKCLESSSVSLYGHVCSYHSLLKQSIHFPATTASIWAPALNLNLLGKNTVIIVFPSYNDKWDFLHMHSVIEKDICLRLVSPPRSCSCTNYFVYILLIRRTPVRNLSFSPRFFKEVN